MLSGITGVFIPRFPVHPRGPAGLLQNRRKLVQHSKSEDHLEREYELFSDDVELVSKEIERIKKENAVLQKELDAVSLRNQSTKHL